MGVRTFVHRQSLHNPDALNKHNQLILQVASYGEYTLRLLVALWMDVFCVHVKAGMLSRTGGDCMLLLLW